MAENMNDSETPTFNFGIDESMVGNPEILKDLFGPETQTANPDDVEPIVKDVPPPEKPVKDTKPKGKELSTPVEKENQTGEEILKNFLGDADDEPPAEDEVPPPDEKETNEEEFSQFEALSKDLFKLGVFTTDNEAEEAPIKTPEEFLERFNAEKQKGALDVINNFIGKFGEDYQNAFEAIYVKGVNPKDYFGVYNTIVKFAELDITNEENQIIVVKQALSEQGLEPDDIDTEIDRLKNYGDLESVSTKYHKVLVKKEAQKLQQLEAKAERELQQKEAIRNQYIQNVQTVLNEKLKSKEFDGIPINPKLANELQDFLLVDKWKTPSGETLTDFDRAILDLKRPENHSMKVKVALLLKILEKDPTLSTIQKAGVSKQSETIFSNFAKQVEKNPKSQSNSRNSFSSL